MKKVIEIPDESYKNIKDQVDKRDYPDMQIGRAIVEGTPLTELLDDIKVEIGTAMATNMGIDGEEDFDKGCKMCLAIIDHHMREERGEKE